MRKRIDNNPLIDFRQIRNLIFYFYWIFVFLVIPASAQLQVTPNNNATQLMNNLVGSGVQIINPVLTCPNAANAAGTFNGATSNIGINNGVLLTTGSVTTAIGPNTIGYAPADTNNCQAGNGAPSADANLQAVVGPGVPMYDACSLQFDLIPSCNTLSINYVFASEEYPEFVCSGYNDGFGFFVSGPNPSGGNYAGKNIALIPGTSIPVAINSVNSGVRGSRSNGGMCTSLGYSNYYVNNVGGTTVQYDGFTKPLVASVSVIPCQTYRMKLIIADAGDCFWDSGVFIEFQGIKCTNTPTTVSPSVAICSGETTTLTAGGGGAATYSWSPATGLDVTTGTSVVASPTVTTTYTVTYSGGTMCVPSTTSVTVTVNPLPNASFSVNPACLNSSTLFSDQSTIPSGNLVGWAWDFGDGAGNVSTVQNPIHTYGAAGNYTVTLTLTSNNGCTASINQMVTVHPIPKTDFTFANVCFHKPIVFTDVSVSNGTTVSSWAWDFGDMSPIGTSPNPVYLYDTTGLHSVKLVIATTDGCKDSITKVVEVYPLPVAGFSVAEVCEGEVSVFIDASTISSGNISNWLWDFGDATVPDNRPAPSHSYTAAGTYTVTLVVGSDKNCSDTVQGTAKINPIPIVSFLVDKPDGCPLHCVKFTDGTSITGDTLKSWLWSFGDSQTAASKNPGHCYSTPGKYDVSLQVISGKECTDVHTQSALITVYDQPQASFVVSPQPTTVLAPLITFTDQSTGASEWYWDFGDKTTLSKDTRDTVHLYSTENDTAYLATLIVKNEFGCADTAEKLVIIGPDFSFYVPNTFTPNKDGLNDLFYGVGSGIKKKEMYLFDRWGNEMFYSSDLEGAWNGRANHGNGELVQQDTYVWLIILEDVYGERHSYVGHVNVIR